MDFTIDCNLPIKKGMPEESCIDEIDIYHESKSVVTGTILIDGVPRIVRIENASGRISALSVSTLSPGDSFEGIPLSETPVKFQKILSSRGFDSDLDIDSLSISGTNVGFYIDDDRFQSVYWE